MMKSLVVLMSAGAAALTVACASAAEEKTDDGDGAQSAVEDGIDRRLGPEVNRICFPRNINGWKTIDGEDNVVLLEEGVNDWYRVEVSGTCREREFRFARAIGIESRPSGGCISRGDVITIPENSGFTHRCFITQINEWDDDAPAPGDEFESETEDKN